MISAINDYRNCMEYGIFCQQKINSTRKNMEEKNKNKDCISDLNLLHSLALFVKKNTRHFCPGGKTNYDYLAYEQNQTCSFNYIEFQEREI